MTHPMQILPSIDVEEAIEVFGALMAARVPSDPNDAYFNLDWSALWREMAGAGWMSLADSKEPGRNGDFSLLDMSAVAEVWGGHLIPLAYVPTLVARRWSSERPQESVAMSYVLPEGENRLIPHGLSAVSVIASDGVIPRDHYSEAGSVDAFAASLPIAITLRPLVPIGSEARTDVAILSAAEAIGAANRVLQITVEYVKTREQFGRPVGSQQAVKHLLTNLHVRIELARSAIAWCCNERNATPRAAIAVLEHCLRVAEGCIQAHGGVGYTWAATPHRYLRHIVSLRRIVVAACTT